MNKNERKLLTQLYWILQKDKNEHSTIYYCKDILQSIMKREYKIAENLLSYKITVPPKELNQYEYISDSNKNVTKRYEPMSDNTLPRTNIRESPKVSANTENLNFSWVPNADKEKY